ncbi:MAG: glycosyltransferase [Planctomycetia bacterium]|nr:glycosyltransferase [Planctomycetia bacterium]
MKLLQLFNEYRSLFNGEEAVVRMTAALIEKHGGQAQLWVQSSRGLEKSAVGKARAAIGGIYNRSAKREMARRLAADRSDVVHAHNLYPLFSPSVLSACREAGVPVVMSVHNHIHTCPRSDHLRHGQLCERCVGGREYHCVLNNCRENIFESIAYAARNAVARRWRLFRDNVTIVIALNEFARGRLVQAGFAPDRVVVVPNMVAMPAGPVDAARGVYVAFSGRLSPEKGADTLLAAARQLPEVPMRLAGDGPALDQLKGQAPPSAHLLGRLQSSEMEDFYRQARFLVVPSKWFEGCPLVISEAMSHGLPVIASRIGGLPELVEDGVTGFLFEPGNAAELTTKIKQLWDSPDLCRRMGLAGRAKAEREFGAEGYYRRLMAIYSRAIALTSGVNVAESACATTNVAVPARGETWSEGSPDETREGMDSWGARRDEAEDQFQPAGAAESPETD